MKNKFKGIKIGILVKKKFGQRHSGDKPFKPYAINPEEHAKFVRNMFSVIRN